VETTADGGKAVGIMPHGEVSWQGLESLTDVASGRRVGVIILAAGLSSRMGRLKQLLPLEGRPLVRWVAELYQQAGLDEMVVVTGHRADELKPAIAQLGAREAFNPIYRQGMFTSVLHGLQALSPRLDAFFLHPVDLPLVRPLTISWLLRSWRGRDEVLHPTWRGRAGHPPLIGGDWRPVIASWSGESGLAGLWRARPQGQRQVPVADSFISKDMDLPLDYKALSAAAPRWEILSRAECLELLSSMLALPEQIIAHGRKVAEVSLVLGRALNAAGGDLDLELLQSAALLHDLARGQSGHARLGAAWLREMGFCALSPLIDSHMEIQPNQQGPLNEKEVLFLADKLVKGDRVVGLEQRFLAKRAGFAGKPQALAALDRRSQAAETLAMRFQAQSGLTLSQALGALTTPD